MHQAGLPLSLWGASRHTPALCGACTGLPTPSCWPQPPATARVGALGLLAVAQQALGIAPPHACICCLQALRCCQIRHHSRSVLGLACPSLSCSQGVESGRGGRRQPSPSAAAPRGACCHHFLRRQRARRAVCSRLPAWRQLLPGRWPGERCCAAPVPGCWSRGRRTAGGQRAPAGVAVFRFRAAHGGGAAAVLAAG